MDKEKMLVEQLVKEVAKLNTYKNYIEKFIKSDDFDKKMLKEAMKENNQEFFELREEDGNEFIKVLNENKIKSLKIIGTLADDIKKEITQEG